MKRGAYHINNKRKNNTHTFCLDHGTVIGMYSDHLKTNISFQAKYEHCVPKRKHVVKGRYNITFRSKTAVQNTRTKDYLLSFAEKSIQLDSDYYALLWRNLLTIEQKEQMFNELKSLKQSMKPDKTFVHGKWHMNNGRLVAELAFEEGQTYTYGGKTTDKGIEFPPFIKQYITDVIAPKIFCMEDPRNIWAHLVYYPGGETGLGWHGDAENGIDPHLIVSITFLESHYNDDRISPGARDFQIREKKYKKKQKTN